MTPADPLVVPGEPGVPGAEPNWPQEASDAVAQDRAGKLRYEPVIGDQIEVLAQMEAANHKPEPGGCTCGFCAWSVEHVVIMSVREAVRRVGLDRV